MHNLNGCVIRTVEKMYQVIITFIYTYEYALENIYCKPKEYTKICYKYGKTCFYHYRSPFADVDVLPKLFIA